MTKIDTVGLKRLARSAKGKGFWIAAGEVVESEFDDEPDVCSCRPEAMGQARFATSHQDLALARAKFIEAVQPRFIIALCRRIEELEAAQ